MINEKLVDKIMLCTICAIVFVGSLLTYFVKTDVQRVCEGLLKEVPSSNLSHMLELKRDIQELEGHRAIAISIAGVAGIGTVVLLILMLPAQDRARQFEKLGNGNSAQKKEQDPDTQVPPD